MIDIDSAINESKTKKNISDGGSPCFDFGDVVLIRYREPVAFLHGKHARDKEDEVMKAINQKADAGVNTPRHIAMKRVIEDEGKYETCYVLEEKCPGVSCESINKYGVSPEEMLASLTLISNIPFEQYKKLILDGCMLYEMGYEAKNKNLFYDSETGFWYIDFLDNEETNKFDPNDIRKIFDALKSRIPKPLYIAAKPSYDTILSPEETEKKKKLEFAIKAKTLLATRACFPKFIKYEKFYLSSESDEYKAYLMKTGITNDNLNALSENDYRTFYELYEIVMNRITDQVVNHNVTYWDIKTNEIRNENGIFNLANVWTMHNDCMVKREDYEDNYDYVRAARDELIVKMITDLTERLRKLPPNESINAFLAKASEEESKLHKTK